MTRSILPFASAFLAFALLAGTAGAQDKAKPTVTPHDLAGRENCMMCHSGAMQGMPAVPADHAGRDNASCQLCHAADSPVQKADPKPTTHDIAGREQCQTCHGVTMPGIPASPESHKGWDNKVCLLCHVPAKK